MEEKPAADRYDRATFRRCGRSGLRLPVISLGLWHNFGGVDSFENGRAIVRRAFDRGVTHLDLANNYGPPPGSAEEAMGRILDLDLRPWRDELVISTKAGYLMWPGPYGEWGSRKYLLSSLDPAAPPPGDGRPGRVHLRPGDPRSLARGQRVLHGNGDHPRGLRPTNGRSQGGCPRVHVGTFQGRRGGQRSNDSDAVRVV